MCIRDSHYLDMAMSLSRPHPQRPHELTGVMLGDEQFAQAADWERDELLALVGIGIEPGLSDVFARYAADHLFASIDELGTRDGANLVIRDDKTDPNVAASNTETLISRDKAVNGRGTLDPVDVGQLLINKATKLPTEFSDKRPRGPGRGGIWRRANTHAAGAGARLVRGLGLPVPRPHTWHTGGVGASLRGRPTPGFFGGFSRGRQRPPTAPPHFPSRGVAPLPTPPFVAAPERPPSRSGGAPMGPLDPTRARRRTRHPPRRRQSRSSGCR